MTINLNDAVSALSAYDHYTNNTANERLAEHAYQRAMMYAAVAQAAALERIADALDFVASSGDLGMGNVPDAVRSEMAALR